MSNSNDNKRIKQVFHGLTGQCLIGIMNRHAFANTESVQVMVASEYIGHMEHIR
jgi:hypothetical protein